MIGLGALGKVFGGWRLWAALGAAAAVLATGGYVVWLRQANAALEDRNAALKGELRQAEQVAAENAAALRQARDDHLADMLLAEHHADFRIEAAAASATILGGIDHVPESDDAPVAPVLRGTLRRLQQRRGPTDDHQDGGRARPGADGPAAVPAGAGRP